MKKVLLFGLVLALAVAFAAPAFAFKIEGDKDAKFYFGGIAMTDIGYWNRSKEFSAAWRTPGGDNSDRTQFILSVPQHSRLRASVEAGNAGAYWELGMGRDNIATHEQGDVSNPTDKFGAQEYISTRKIYGWYKFGNCTLMAGKNDGSFWVLQPTQSMGLQHNGHVVGLGWGSLYDTRENQVRFTQDISKTMSYQIALVQPGTTDVTIAGVNYDAYSDFPRVDGMFKMDFGVVSLYPAGTWQLRKFNGLPSSFDAEVPTWYVQLPLKVKAGAFTGMFELGYGQNLNVFQLQSAYHQALWVGGKLKNTTGLIGFFDLAFTAGPVTPHFYMGYDKAENTDAYVGDKAVTRLMYGVGVDWMISPNFVVRPEFTYYDWGKNPAVAGNPDLGKEWIGGVQFAFVF
jgi:hypothetical protein